MAGLTAKEWWEIIKYILDLIFGGESKEEAVKKAAQKFNVSESSIWKRGGF